MSEQEILLLIILVVAAYLLYVYLASQKSPLLDIPRTIMNKKYAKPRDNRKYPYRVDYIADPLENYKPEVINPYHPDYVEVISVVDKLIKPSIFNPASLPIVVNVEADKKDAFPIANRFVYDLSKKAGISLKLVDIIYVRKQLTDSQERLKFDIVVQKELPIPTKIKMLMRVVIVYNTDDVVNEDNFFDKAWQTRLNKKPILDEVYILGYSSGYFDIESQAQTEYYAFKDVDDTSFMDNSTVNGIVQAVRRRHALETGCLNAAWDEDGRDYAVRDLDASNWGMVDRRGLNAQFTKAPKPCGSFESDQLYGAIGTKVLD